MHFHVLSKAKKQESKKIFSEKLKRILVVACHTPTLKEMSGTATTCPGTSLGIPKYPGHVPGLQCPRMSHAKGACGSWNT